MDEVLSECVLLTCAQPRQGPRCFRSWERQSLLWVHVQMLAPCAGKCHWWTLPSFRCLQPEIDHYRHSLSWLAKPVSLSMIHKTHTHTEFPVCLPQSTRPPDFGFSVCVSVCLLFIPSLLGSRQPHSIRMSHLSFLTLHQGMLTLQVLERPPCGPLRSSSRHFWDGLFVTKHICT